MGSVIMLQTWRILPLATVIVMAGLSSIPQDIRDATEVDGARFWRRTFQIDLPLLAPVILVALLFGVVFTFADMAVIFILTGGAPSNGTQVLASWAFYKGSTEAISRSARRTPCSYSRCCSPSPLSCCGSRADRTWPEMATEVAGRRVRGRVGLWVLIVLFGLFCAFPFLFAAITMFKQNTDLYTRPNGNQLIFTKAPTLSNITLLFHHTPYVTFIVNNLVIGACVVLITLALSVPAAYSLARVTGRWGEKVGIGIFVVTWCRRRCCSCLCPS